MAPSAPSVRLAIASAKLARSPMNPNRCLSLDAFDALTAAAPGHCLLDVGTPQRFAQATFPVPGF